MRMFLMMLLFATPVVAGEAEFIDAVRARDLATVKKMLDADPSLVNAHGKSGTPAPFVAMFAQLKGEEGFLDPKSNEVLQVILAHGPKLDLHEVAAFGTADQLAALLHDDPQGVSRLNNFGWTPLHIAAFTGNTGTAELLIARGADVNARAKTQFLNVPLQTALLSGQYATAKLLLDHGADVLVRQAEGFSALHEAAQSGREDIVKLLLDHGAEVNARSNDGRTALDFAVKEKRVKVVELLRAKIAALLPSKD